MIRNMLELQSLMKIWDSKNILGMVISTWECEFVVGEAASEQAFGEVVNASPGVADGKTLDGFPTLC